MTIKSLVISALFLGSLPFVAHSAESGPVVWMSYPIALECPSDATLKVRVNSLSEPVAGKPITADVENLSGNTLYAILDLKHDTFEGRMKGYVKSYSKATLTTAQAYPFPPGTATGWLKVSLVECVVKSSGK